MAVGTSSPPELQWGADGVGFGMEREEQELLAHGNVVHSCIWEEAEEDVLMAEEDGGGTEPRGAAFHSTLGRWMLNNSYSLAGWCKLHL